MTTVSFDTGISPNREAQPLLAHQLCSARSLDTTTETLITNAAISFGNSENSHDSDSSYGSGNSNDNVRKPMKDRRSTYYQDYASVKEFRRSIALRKSKIGHKSIPHLLYRMPNTGFGIPLGLGGQAILWKTLYHVKHFAHGVGETTNRCFWLLSLISAIVILFLNVLKGFKYPFIVSDEWKHPVRCHFFNAPHLIICMLSISVPDELVEADDSVNRVLFAICLSAQFTCTIPVYRRWLFDDTHTIRQARPQFFLSGVGWFLLTVMGQMCDIKKEWGVDVPSFCFGAGMVLYVVIVTCVFLASSQAENIQRSPAMFLFIAPPSVAAVAAMNFDGTFGQTSRYLFGWCLLLLPLLLRMAHAIFDNVPSAYGVNWAYVFPLAGIATASAKYADVEDTMGSSKICYALTVLSLAILGLVLYVQIRTMVQVMRRKEGF